MILARYALFRPVANVGSSEQYHLAFFPYDSVLGEVQYPVDRDLFRELWGHGLLYLAGKTSFADAPAMYFLLTGTAQILWSVYNTPAKASKLSSELLAILNIMARSFYLHVIESNGPHTTWKCRLQDKKLLRSAVAQIFVKHGWVIPVGLPTNPAGNLRAWQWTYELSEEGRNLVKVNIYSGSPRCGPRRYARRRMSSHCNYAD
jgi:hypothetical protein